MFIRAIEELCGRSLKYRVFTDSAPILERDLAQRAGLGWIGKNSCLIDPEIGSFFFLSEILLDLALPPDSPFTADHCGKCNRCVTACPTECILPNRTIDARRCIAYLTIESRTALPEPLRPALDTWIFGCDICQTVCPWNHHAINLPVIPEFQRDGGSSELNLVEILQMSEAHFNERFAESPIRRTKWQGLARNAAVALTNLAKNNPQLSGIIAEILTKVLKTHPDALVRQHIVWSLQRVNSQSAKEAL